MKKLELKVITYFFGKFISAVISLAIIPLFINWFGDVKYGEYILIYTTFLIFVSGSMGWINQSMIKHHGDYNSDREDFYTKVHKLSYQVAIIASVPLIFLVYFSSKGVTLTLLTFIAIAFIFGCRYTSKLIENQAELNSLRFTTAEIIRLSTFFLLVFLLKHLTFLNPLEIIFLSLLLGYIMAFIFLNRGIGFIDFKLNFRFDKQLIKMFAGFGIPLSVWMMLSPSANGIDRYILNYYLGAGALAQYTAIYDVVFKIFTQLANPINSVFQPLLMKINSSGDTNLFNKTLKKALLYLSLICVPVFFALYWFQDFVLINYLGFKNEETLNQLKPIIIPLALSGFIWQIAIIAQKQLEAKNKTLIMAIGMFIVIVSFSIITAILVPKYGVLAAAYTAVSSSLVYLLVILLLNRNESKKKLYNR